MTPTIRCTRKPDPSASNHAGYHQFLNAGGSFEVFFDHKGHDPSLSGWYWWACFPGCLPDGDQSGPHRTSYLAYVDARGEP